MKDLDTKLEEVTIELKELEKQSALFSRSINSLQSKHIKLLQEKCKDNIGRCFKRIRTSREGKETITYCKVIATDDIQYKLIGLSFNEYQYPAIWFECPYNNSSLPFTKEHLFSGAWGKGNSIIGNSKEYTEICRDEYIEKFNEVNLEWVSHIDNI